MIFNNSAGYTLNRVNQKCHVTENNNNPPAGITV